MTPALAEHLALLGMLDDDRPHRRAETEADVGGEDARKLGEDMRTFAEEMDEFITCVPEGPMRHALARAFTSYLSGGRVAKPNDWRPKSVSSNEPVKPTYEELEDRIRKLETDLRDESGQNYPWP